jgi:hypothetical protein
METISYMQQALAPDKSMLLCQKLTPAQQLSKSYTSEVLDPISPSLRPGTGPVFPRNVQNQE